MHLRSFAQAAGLAGLLLALASAGCKKQPEVTRPVEPPPAPVPAPPRPTVTLQASPTFIQKGETVTLSWSSTNATNLEIAPGVGRVAAEGSTRVTPDISVTYTITASGPGGTANQSVRITVAAAPLPARPEERQATLDELFRENVFDIYFDYDKADIRPDARDSLARTAEFLRTHADIRIVIEGHCDERGSTEYNIALGQRRAEAARQFLISLGVTGDRLDTVSYGKEKPFCMESNEACWQQNRRAHFVQGP